MDKYEYKQLSERMIELMQNEEYGEAKEIADSIDWRRVRNAMMLANVSDIYEKTGAADCSAAVAFVPSKYAAERIPPMIAEVSPEPAF